MTYLCMPQVRSCNARPRPRVIAVTFACFELLVAPRISADVTISCKEPRTNVCDLLSSRKWHGIGLNVQPQLLTRRLSIGRQWQSGM